MSEEQSPTQRSRAGAVFAIIFAIILFIALIVWKVIIFKRAARTSNGWAVFTAFFSPPFDALTFLFKKKCVAA